jgi:hypothetical protein
MTSTRTQAWHQGAAEAASMAIAYVRPECGSSPISFVKQALNLDSHPPGS